MIGSNAATSDSTKPSSCAMADAVVANDSQAAQDLLRQMDWLPALQLYEQLLLNVSSAATPTKTATVDQTIAHLIGLTECQLQLNQYENLVTDCRRLLPLLLLDDTVTEASSTVTRIRRRLIHGLYCLKRYTEAEEVCCAWSQSIVCTPTTTNTEDIVKWLDRYRTVIQIANGQKSNQRISVQRLDKEMATLDAKLEVWATINCGQDRFHSISSGTTPTEPVDTDSTKGVQDKAGENSHQAKPIAPSSVNGGSSVPLPTNSGSGKDVSSSAITCTYCSISFSDRLELRAHCQTEQHQNVIMSDEGRDWKWRPPPRGYSADSYNLCESFSDNGLCHYSNQCAEAHGVDELIEWKDRLEYRKMRVKRACEKELYGKSYTEQLLEKWVNAPSPDRIMSERIDGVEETISNDLVTTVSSKASKRDWTFVLKTKRPLHAVALLQDAHRNHFVIAKVLVDNVKAEQPTEAELSSDQEWVCANVDNHAQEEASASSEGRLLEHTVNVVFSTDIFGTFRQTVVLDFGQQPVLIKQVCVDVIPISDADKIQEIRNEMVLSSAERWNSDNATICLYTTPVVPHLTTPAYLADEVREKDLLDRYPCPKASTFTLTQPTITEKRLTKNNYRSRIHELLYVEEIARYEQVAKYNLRTTIRVTNNYVLTPSGMATSTAKYSHSGELFALLTLGKDVSEDTSAGRLILNNCTSVYIAKAETDKHAQETNGRHVYEAMIEDKGKTMIYLKLSAQGVKDLGMTSESDFDADIQFQLNRLSYCEWHHALDKIADFRLIFPETYIEPNIEWSPRKHWDDSLDHMLNSKQKEAVLAITTPTTVPLPPILLIGPFGTGKTFTLASSIKQVLLQPETRILICTHSNSAADLYIKDYLHPWVEEGMEEAKPLRVYYHKRWVATVNTTVQKYCLIDLNINVRNFRRPTREDIMKYRIVVVTLSISMELASLGLPKGYFTHIFLDEAAQAMECEAIMPLALAGDTTRIVLAGDHMQMSPELFSNFAKERKLHISLLERLYDHYPADFPCKILLCENYRAHEAITKFTSELFYDQKLIASGKQPRHERYYPLTFFTTRGEDVQDKNSTAFYNNSEVYEVVERVSELRKKWPTPWGKLNDQSIGIMTPYADQVFRIRAELRKRRLGGISVERVLNVQGKQFRAVFLSTVRTRRTCTGSESGGKSENMDYGFLSNSKLLNTAITRAQSLVAVVGDPVALCSIGRCRKVWERFIEICNLNQSLVGITWSTLRSQLDGVELKKTYVLNPLAPEFVPRALQAESYLRDQQLALQHSANNHQSQPTTPQQPQPPSVNQAQLSAVSHPAQQHVMSHGHPHGGHHHGPHAPMASSAHHMNHGNFPHQPLMQPPMRPPMPHFGGGPPGQPMHPNASQQYPPFVFYPNQPQPPPSVVGPHGPPSQQQVPPIIRPPPHMQPPQPQPNFLPSNQQNLWGPSPQFPNAPNPWPKLGTGPHMNRPQTMPMAQGPPLNMPPSVRQQQQQQQQQQQHQQLRSPVSQQQLQQTHMPHPSQQQQQQLSYLQGGNKTSQSIQPPMHGQPPFMQMAVQNQQQQQQQNAMRMGPGPVSPANLMHPSAIQQSSHQDQHMAPLSSDVLATIAARVNQAAQVQAHQHAAKQRGNNGTGADHLMDKELQFMQQAMVGGAGGNLQHPQAMSGGVVGGSATLPLGMMGDFSFLLPANMSFYEMALEPKEYQFKWFVKIVDNHGIEMANKFTEILRQMPSSLANMSVNHSSTKILHRHEPAHNFGAAGDMNFDLLSTSLLNELMLKEQQQQQQQQHMHQQHQHQQHQQQHHNQLQHHNNQPSIGLHHHQQQQQQQQSHPLLTNHQLPNSGSAQHVSNATNRHTNDLSLVQRINSPPSLAASSAASASAMQSVPLYRRQAGLNQSAGIGADLLNDPNAFDSILFSQNDGSFQGLPPIHTLAAGLQQQQQQLQQQQHLSKSYASGMLANPLLMQQHQFQQQQHQLQAHRDSTNGVASGTSGRMGAGGDELLPGRQASVSGGNTTYASVLSQGSSSNNHKPAASPDDKDPFAAIRELGQRSNGFYNYFQ